MKLAILTEDRYENPKELNPYTDNILKEETLLVNAFKKHDVEAIRCSWSNSEIDWSQFSAVLFRSTWDYFNRLEEFNKFIFHLPDNMVLLNSERLIQWNQDKRYLFDLANAGIRIPKTILLVKSDRRRLAEIIGELSMDDAVIKPCVSGAAKNTYKISSKILETELEKKLLRFRKTEDFLLQEFMPKIVSEGEISLVFFKDQFSHAILKKAKAGDFRVQDDFGGSIEKYTPTEAEIRFGSRCIKACKKLPVYSRVDIAYNHFDELCLMELELIEPELWFREFPDAADTMVNACLKEISSGL